MTGPAFRHLQFDALDSTNAQARRQAAAPEFEAGVVGADQQNIPLWITARSQTAGRGRRGRDWVSKPGNLFATLLIRLPVPLTTAAQLSFVASLAIYDAAASLLPASVRLEVKWPNDVLLGGQKLAGILIETVPCANKAYNALAIGCGVNLQHAPDETAYGATWLNAHNNYDNHGKEPVSAEQFFEVLAAKMNIWLNIWQNGQSFDLIARAWQDRASHIGKIISLSSAHKMTIGKFLRLASDGALVLELADGSQKHFHAGDVSFSQPADNRSHNGQ